MSEWRTGEPPQTELLVWREDAGVFIAEYVDGCWFVKGGAEDLTGDMFTHWMPLPEPPR